MPNHSSVNANLVLRLLAFALLGLSLATPIQAQIEGYGQEAVLLDAGTHTLEELVEIRSLGLVRNGPWDSEFIARGGETGVCVYMEAIPFGGVRFEGEDVLAFEGPVAHSNEAVELVFPEGGWVRVGPPAGYLALNVASAAQGCRIELVLENQNGETWAYDVGAPYEGLDLPPDSYFFGHFPWTELLLFFDSGMLAPRSEPKGTQLVRLHSIIIRPVGMARRLAELERRFSLMSEEQRAGLLDGPPPIEAGESRIELYIRNIRIGW